MQAYGAYQSSKNEQAAYNYNATVNEQQAQDALARGDEAVSEHQRKVDQLKGRQRAVMAANGLDLGEGSALNILTDTDLLGAYDAQVIRKNAEREAWGHRAQAGLNRYSADSQSPLLAGTSTLLGGSGTVASKWYDFHKSDKG
ncbi:MAG TPA: hypothetical protein VIN36_09130 [Thiobacillus sp.]